ncbi:MAG: aminoacyl-tRNA hydrolase [Patescibacteria group bacterium]
MKLIVGLGNPGEKYKNNRHNVGWMVIDAITKIQNLKLKSQNYNSKLKSEIFRSGDVVLAKPTTFMNDSGRAVQALTRWFKVKPDDLYVIHDDLDISLGGYKIQKGKGPELHYGVQSVDRELGTKDYWRVRVGVDNRDPENRISGERYTLEDFTEEEKKILDGVIEEIVVDLARV